MPLDANGIWIYDEFEDAAPFSTLLNKLAQSTSDAIEAAVQGGTWTNAGILYASNWEDYQPSVSNNHVEYSVVGREVEMRGLVRRAAALSPSQTVTVLTLPAAIRPTRNVITYVMSNPTWVSGGASTGTAHTHAIAASSTSGPILRLAIEASTGNLSLTIPAGVTFAAGEWVSLGGLRWRLG